MDSKHRPASAAGKRAPKAYIGEIRTSDHYSLYYSATASSLNKRPLAEIYQESQKKGPNGEKRALQNPATKKQFKYVTSKIDNGVKRKSA